MTTKAAVETAKDTTSGIASAVSQTLVGYPFNTVKVRMQVAAAGRFRSPMHCCVEILQKEGVGGLYKGMAPMMIGQQLTNITLFATYQRIRRLLDPSYAFVGADTGQMSVCCICEPLSTFFAANLLHVFGLQAQFVDNSSSWLLRWYCQQRNLMPSRTRCRALADPKYDAGQQ
jgi:hypothetical protein